MTSQGGAVNEMVVLILLRGHTAMGIEKHQQRRKVDELLLLIGDIYTFLTLNQHLSIGNVIHIP